MVDVRDVQRHDLLGAQATGVGELEQGAIAQLAAARSAGMRVEQARDLGRLQHMRQVRAATRRGEQIGRALLDLAVLALAAKQGTDRGELARGRRGRELVLGEHAR